MRAETAFELHPLTVYSTVSSPWPPNCAGDWYTLPPGGSLQGGVHEGINCCQNGYPLMHAAKTKKNMELDMHYREGQAVRIGGSDRTCTGT